ncbi:MAG: SGNH/GDSL hydrolase family protein [Candidatus Eisenbacteria bacterium]|nr:SGNH/GDSL hydrolase family protein [Candidatus Eisenbacteria bacterium]
MHAAPESRLIPHVVPVLLLSLVLLTASSSCGDDASPAPDPDCASTVRAPNGGEVWPVGSADTIRWVPGPCGGALRIELLRAGEVCRIVANETPDDGAEPWIASQCGSDSTGYRLRITHLASGEQDESDADFSLPVRVQDVGRVLFLGNSLTYTNDLPGMVEALALASGIAIETDEITTGGYGLIDHWNIPARREAVRTGNYDVVILQQGPSSLPESRDLLREWTVQWEPDIRAGGARPGLYAVWPDDTRLFAFPAVSESYRLAAEDVDGLFFPAGDGWLETWKQRPDAALYGPDGFHPSLAGSYVAAVTILAVLAQRDATTLSPDLAAIGGGAAPLDSTLAATIRSAVQTVLAHR